MGERSRLFARIPMAGAAVHIAEHGFHSTMRLPERTGCAPSHLPICELPALTLMAGCTHTNGWMRSSKTLPRCSKASNRMDCRNLHPAWWAIACGQLAHARSRVGNQPLSRQDTARASPLWHGRSDSCSSRRC